MIFGERKDHKMCNPQNYNKSFKILNPLASNLFSKEFFSLFSIFSPLLSIRPFFQLMPLSVYVP